MKKIISVFLIACLIVNSCVMVYAGEKQPIEEFYKINITALSSKKYDIAQQYEVHFMIRKDSENAQEKLYIMAEEFPYMTNSYFSYDQTTIECAYWSEETTELVRFAFGEKNVSVLFSGQNILYEAPFESLYEHGVAWIPFDFAVKLFNIKISDQGNQLMVNSSYYTYFSAANKINTNIRDWRYDPIIELNQGEFNSEVASRSASFVNKFSKLASLEPASMASVIMTWIGQPLAYDSEYADRIAQVFIKPSADELTVIKDDSAKFKNTLSTALNVVNFNSDMDDIKVDTGLDLIKFLKEKCPNLKINFNFDKLSKIAAKKDVAKKIDPIVKKAFNKKTLKGGQIFLTAAVEVLELLEYYDIFEQKNQRAVAALKQYSKKSEREESMVFSNYASDHKASEFLAYLGANAVDLTDSGFNIASVFNGYVAAYKIGWSLAMNLSYFKKNLSATDFRTLSDYAMIYQDESLKFIPEYEAAMGSGQDSDEILNTINAMYSYLKFSYIARNAACASFETGTHPEDFKIAISRLNGKNAEVAFLLSAFESDFFFPEDCSSSWDDSVFISHLRENGTKTDRPQQYTVPSDDISNFPGLEKENAIDEEEAIALVRKTFSKYTLGLSELLLSDVYGFECIDKYVDKEKSITLFVVGMTVGGNPDSIFLVPYDGSSVYLGEKKSDGTYFYLEVDLLHGTLIDICKTLFQETYKLLESEGIIGENLNTEEPLN